jgi:hypothetical protein
MKLQFLASFALIPTPKTSIFIFHLENVHFYNKPEYSFFCQSEANLQPEMKNENKCFSFFQPEKA